MENFVLKIERYKVHTGKGWQCVEDLRGYYRAIRKINSSEYEICETVFLPKIFETYKLLTRAEMEWSQFFQGYTINYVPIRKLSDAKTPEERAEIWQEQRVRVAGFESQGYQITKVGPDKCFELEIPLKIYDHVTLDHVQRIEFEARKRRYSYQKILNQ